MKLKKMQEENRENKEKKKEIQKMLYRLKRKKIWIKTKKQSKKFIIFQLLNYQIFKHNRLMKILFKKLFQG
jgi:hypothetical protein